MKRKKISLIGGGQIGGNLALLAAITEKAGHEAKIIDGELEKIYLDEIATRSKKYNIALYTLKCILYYQICRI